MGISEKRSTLDIRVPILGVFSYTRLHEIWREISLMDIESYRQAMNLNSADTEPLSQGEQNLLRQMDEETDIFEMFADEDAFIEIEDNKETNPQETLQDTLKKLEFHRASNPYCVVVVSAVCRGRKLSTDCCFAPRRS